MRVLIDYRPALRERSGVGEYTHQLVRALLAWVTRPLELTLFSSSWRDRLTLPDDLAGAAVVDCRVPVRLLNLSWHRFGWPPAESLARREFDVTHSLHPLLMPARSAAQVITIHDLNFLSHPERTRAEIRRDYPVLARAHAQRADAIVTPSAFTAGEVTRQFAVDPARIAICSPGAPEWTPRASTPRDGYVLFFGTLEPRKNVGALLDAYEQLLGGHRVAGTPKPSGEGGSGANAGALPELVLAGKATDEARPWLDRIARPPLKGVVRHIGYVDPAERQALYAGARLLVMPSYEEGFGLPVLEAMTIGVPVVAARRGSLPEVLGDAGPLVDPDQPSDIAAGIARVLSDAAYESACVLAGLERAAQFRWAQTAERVYDTYQQAMAWRAGRGAAV